MAQIGKKKLDRAQKQAAAAALYDMFQNTGVVVVAHYSGLSVAQMTDLRRQMRDGGGQVKVAKNRLVKIALKGTGKEGIADLFTGPTVLVYSDDPVAAPKVAAKFAKAHEKFVILGGAMGATLLDPKGVSDLSELPSLDELRGKLVGLLQAPASKLARVVQAPAGQLARVISAYSEKEEAA